MYPLPIDHWNVDDKYMKGRTAHASYIDKSLMSMQVSLQAKENLWNMCV
jgi:hypothetical protein